MNFVIFIVKINITTTTVEPTSTPTNSEPSVTIKPGHNVYWFYHAFTSKCLYAPQKPNNLITVKACDDSNYSKWMVFTSRKGYFYSMAHPDYCLRVSDVDTGSLELGKCDEQAKMVHDDDGFFGLIESSDKCVGFLNDKDMYNDEIEMNLNTCTKSDAEKFYNWDRNPTTSNTFCFSEVLDDPYPCCSDPDAVVAFTDEHGKWGIENDHWCGILGSENTVAPPTDIETYFLYNSYSDKCIHSSGILESPITLGECDYTTYSLWDVPYTHNGHFHLKFDTSHCIMLSDNGSLVLGECGDTSTVFYNDNNYLKSPIAPDQCISFTKDFTLIMSECNEFDTTQLFYFNNWEEEPLEPTNN